MTVPPVRHLAFAILLAGSRAAFAQGTDAQKQEALDRYLRAVPMSKMMDDSYAAIAKQAPPEQRQKFIGEMRRLVDAERIEQIARAAMLKTFSADELNALADFYSSKHGASAMAKYGSYMAEVMPPLMQEVQRAMLELQSQQQQQPSQQQPKKR